MQRKYSIPITLVSVTTAALFGISVLPSTETTLVSENTIVTENTTLGYDFEYDFTVPRIAGNDALIVELPKGANLEPVGLHTDSFGERRTFTGILRNDREVVYNDLEAGIYRFVYTSFDKNDLLSDGDVYVEEN